MSTTHAMADSSSHARSHALHQRLVLEPLNDATSDEGVLRLGVDQDGGVVLHGADAFGAVACGPWRVVIAAQDASLARPELRIVTREGDQVVRLSRTLQLDETGSFLIGRSRHACDLVLGDGHVSSRHLRIYQEGDRYYAQDVGSRWGTSLNGRRVNNPAEIHHGDLLNLGNSTLQFITQPPTGSGTSSPQTPVTSDEHSTRMGETSGTLSSDEGFTPATRTSSTPHPSRYTLLVAALIAATLLAAALGVALVVVLFG
jgi:hypothetical protein